MRWIFVLNPPYCARSLGLRHLSLGASTVLVSSAAIDRMSTGADGDAPAWLPRSISTKAISGFVRAMPYSAGPSARSNRARLLAQLSGRNSRNASMTGASPRAHVSDTRVWQFAVLPSAEAYWEATPSECMPFLGIAVSSITGTASLPPTNLSAPCAAKNLQRAGPLPPCPHGGVEYPPAPSLTPHAAPLRCSVPREQTVRDFAIR